VGVTTGATVLATAGNFENNQLTVEKLFNGMHSPLVGVTTGVMMLDKTGSIGNSGIKTDSQEVVSKTY